MKKYKGKDVITISKTYLDTPWKHQGRVKGVGIDCAGLIIKVMEELEFDISFDIMAYERMPDGLKLAQLCNENAIQKNIKDVEDGDILLFNILGNPQHLAFYSNENGLDYFIHAHGDKSVNKVCLMRLDSKWKNRLVGVYKIKGIE